MPNHNLFNRSFFIIILVLLGFLILMWYFYEKSPLITNDYRCSQVPSFKLLLSKFKPNPFIGLQVTVSESNQPSNFLQRCKEVDFVCWLNTTFCVKKSYQKPRPSSINIIRSLLRGMKWNEITTPEIINKIHDVVLNDPNVKVREIAEIVSISTERKVNISHSYLCMNKLCARWVPRFLTINQKWIRITTSE